MKKFEITIQRKSGAKTVKVYVEDRTAALLLDCSEEVRQTYLEEEYRAQRKEVAETKRHISLERSMEKGYDFEDVKNSSLHKVSTDEEYFDLENVLKKLTDKQREVFILYVFEEWTLEEIGEKMGVSYQAIQCGL